MASTKEIPIIECMTQCLDVIETLETICLSENVQNKFINRRSLFLWRLLEIDMTPLRLPGISAK